jgi:hypothetical protein
VLTRLFAISVIALTNLGFLTVNILTWRFDADIHIFGTVTIIFRHGC